MRKVHQERFSPHPPEKLFELVADIEKYPEFLPWITSARILSRDETGIVAELSVGYKHLRESYVSKVRFDRAALEIESELVSGPFSHLRNFWRFRPAEGGAMVLCHVEFALKSKMLDKILGAFLDKAVRGMAEAFERRAG